MKKITTAVLSGILAGAMALSLTACSDMEEPAEGETNESSAKTTAAGEKLPETSESAGGQTEGDEEFIYGKAYMDAHFPAEYAITYTVTTFEAGEGSDAVETTYIKTKDGIYTKSGDSDFLLLKAGDKYDMCEKAEDGVFERMKVEGFDMQLTAEEAEVYSMLIFGYFGQYEAFGDELKRSGSTSVAGRSCDQYIYEASLLGVSTKMTYCIDKETGICLKYSLGVAAEGEKSGYEFECKSFQTSGVSLPAYR